MTLLSGFNFYGMRLYVDRDYAGDRLPYVSSRAYAPVRRSSIASTVTLATVSSRAYAPIRRFVEYVDANARECLLARMRLYVVRACNTFCQTPQVASLRTRTYARFLGCLKIKEFTRLSPSDRRLSGLLRSANYNWRLSLDHGEPRNLGKSTHASSSS